MADMVVCMLQKLKISLGQYLDGVKDVFRSMAVQSQAYIATKAQDRAIKI